METYIQIVSVGSAVPAAGLWIYLAIIQILNLKDIKLNGRNSPSGYVKKIKFYSVIAVIFSSISAVSQVLALYLHGHPFSI